MAYVASKTINKTEAKRILRTLKKKHYQNFFVVEFLKRENSELRRMICRFGVRKHVKGVGLKFKPKEHHLMTCFDVQKKSYRMISLERLVSLQIEGKLYRVA